MPTYASNQTRPTLNERPIEGFLERLCGSSAIGESLTKAFGEQTAEMVGQLVSSAEIPESAWEALDLVRHILHEDAEVVSEWCAEGSHGEYPIRVMRP